VTRILLFVLALLLVLPGTAQELKVLNRSNPGEHFELARFLQQDKTNVVVFHSRHSAPSVSLARLLEELQPKRRDLTVSLVDVDRRESSEIDWRSPLVRQYNLRTLPYVMITDGRGQKIAEGHAARREILQWLDAAGIESTFRVR